MTSYLRDVPETAREKACMMGFGASPMMQAIDRGSMLMWSSHVTREDADNLQALYNQLHADTSRGIWGIK